MFRNQKSGVPYFMTYPRGHLQVKLFCLIRLRKVFDVSLTDLYTTKKFKIGKKDKNGHILRKWNFSKFSDEELQFNSEWKNEPYFHPPYIVNIHDETISVFKLENEIFVMKWALNFPCDFYEKTT